MLRKTKRAHHLWSADKSEGKLRIKRSDFLDEDDPLVEEPVTSRKRSSRRVARRVQVQDAKEATQALFGVWGATLVDDDTFTKPIPQALVQRFNATVGQSVAPKTYTWSELNKAVGAEKIAVAKAAVQDGMKTRLIAKELDVPFLVAAEIIDKLDGMDMTRVRAAVHAVKYESLKVASREYGSLARTVASAFNQFKGRKLAVDEKAQAYFESYYGPYGQEMVAEIQRRVRADLAHRWLLKNGVDEKAAEYWSHYYSDTGYGAEMISAIPKKLSPVS